MRPILLLFAAILILGGSASAQVYALEFSDEKYQKPFKKQLFDWNGKTVLIVEVGPDMKYGSEGEPTWEEEERISFYVQDQSDPTNIGYVLDKEGRRKLKKKKLVVALSSERVEGLLPFLPQESFVTLAKVATRELAKIDALEDAIKEAKADPEGKAALQRELVQAIRDYQFWLRRTGYSKAADDLEKPLKKLHKALGHKTGKVVEASYKIRTVEPSEKLVEAGHRVGGPRLNFQIQESERLRIVYHTGIEDAAIERMLQLGERVIDEFHARAIAPTLPEGAADPLGEGIFLELFLGTKERMHQEKMLGDYYGLEWGKYMGDADKGRNRGNHFYPEDRDLSYWRVDEQVDIEGVLLHRLGHALAKRAYGVEKDKQDWIEEGLGYQLSLRYLGHSNGSCVVFPNFERSNASQVIQESMETRIAKAALADGPAFQNLFGLQLYTYEVQHVAKAWAFMAYLDSAAGSVGHTWLRELTPTLKERNYTEGWYQRMTALFGLGKGNAPQLLESQWKDWMAARYGLE
ncbi:MAG: hypothetical protein ACPG31_04265 [Planctomycetota bacterium]